MPLEPPACKRLFSAAKAASDPLPSSLKPNMSTLLTMDPNLMRQVSYSAHPHLHPAAIEQPVLQSSKFAKNGEAHAQSRPPPILPDSFYSSETRGSRSSIGVSANALASRPSSSSYAYSTPHAPEPPQSRQLSRATHSQTKEIAATTPSDQSVVVIDSDDDGVDVQSPKYTSPGTISGAVCCCFCHCLAFQ